MRSMYLLLAVLISAGCVAVEDGEQLHEFATQTHDFVGNVSDIVNECFPSSPADGSDVPGEAAAMEFAGVWISSCEQEAKAGGWPAGLCSMSYSPTGRGCE